jgi:hypothetical protein
MYFDSRTIILITKRVLLGTMVCFAAFPASGQVSERVPVNIFGDGNTENGVEDSREPVMGGRNGEGHQLGHRLNAGAIKCDGKTRGTAVVVDTREFAPDLKGVVLATAAHVLYDLDKKHRFRRCEFHFLALSELASYRAEIDLERVRLGDFDPTKTTTGIEFGEGDWAFLYVPKPWRRYRPDEALALRDFSFIQMESFQQAGGEIRLVAFDSSTKVVSESRDCTVVESDSDDLGGGAWKGQLLDDCDSTGGASGGGIVAVLGDQQYLIGIRGGSHWSEQVFPADEYPSGPPDGSIWDRRTNTNFGRAIDEQLLRELERFIQTLAGIRDI